MEIVRRTFGGIASGAVRRVFVERRADLRIEFGGGSEPVRHETRASGVAIETTGSGGAVRRTMDPQESAGVAVPDPSAGIAVIGDLTVASNRIQGATIRGVWVSSDQRVAVRVPDRDPVTDRRTGSRIRLEAEVRSRFGVGRAALDHVFGPGRPFDAETLVAAVHRRASERLKAIDVGAGEHLAVFDAGVGGILIHELIGHPLESDDVSADVSRLARESPSFRDEEIRVVDDPRRGRVPWTVDDEGEPARAVGLVDRGRVTGLMLDRRRAEALGSTSTGHGRCTSYRDDVRPRMGCTFLAAGRLDPEEIVADTASGIFIRRMIAASADPAAGTACLRVSDADRIERGRRTRPLSPFVIEVGLSDLLQGLDRVGRDLMFDTTVASCIKGGQPLAVSVGAPTIRLPVNKVSP